jgi:hypothetical protein
MIEETLGFLANELNAHFKSRRQIKQDKVIVGSLMNNEGKPNSKVEDKVVIMLMNVLEEKTNQSNSTRYARDGSRPIGRISPPIDLNLNVLFAANFKDYKESLKFLSGLIGYFQVNRVFMRTQFPTLMPGADKLTMEIINFDADNLHNLWGMVGSRYLPSMMYRCKTLRIQESVVKEQVTPITGLRPEAQS